MTMRRSVRPTPPEDAVPWPTHSAELEPAERLLLWAFRRWVFGLSENAGAQCALVWTELARLLGPVDGQVAAAALAGLTRELQGAARRRLRHHRPCCPCLSTDEIAIIGLVGACQRRALPLACALAEWLVLPDGAGGLLDCAARLGRVLQRHGLPFPNRVADAVSDADPGDPPRVAATRH